jgi:hypothetical protein
LDAIKILGIIDLTTNLKIESKQPLQSALQMLNRGLTKLEVELLDKKKTETFQLCLEKLRAFRQHIRQQLQYQPEMIGCQVGAAEFCDQANAAFDFWVHYHLEDIKKRIKDVEHFSAQVGLARSDAFTRTQFISQWKFVRCLHQDAFDAVYTFVVAQLGIPEKDVMDTVVEAKIQNDSAEDSDMPKEDKDDDNSEEVLDLSHLA